MRKYALPLLGIAATAAVLFALTMWLFVWQFEISTDDAYVQADIAAIAPKISGYVRKIHVADNQRVQAGELLAELDTSDLQPKLEQAVALVESRNAAVTTSLAKTALQQSVIVQAQANVAAAVAESHRSQRDVERFSELEAKGFASHQRTDLARADSAKASAAVERARAALETERSQLPVLEGAVAQARADLKQSQAQNALAEAELANAKLIAPFAGIVGNRTVQTGQFVRAGTQIMSIVPLPHVYVVANFKETQMQELAPGQKVRIKVDALPSIKFTGFVDSLAPASGSLFSLLPPENATGNFTKIVQRIPVRIRVEGDTGDIARLRAGMSVSVTIDIRERPQAPKAP